MRWKDPPLDLSQVIAAALDRYVRAWSKERLPQVRARLRKRLQDGRTDLAEIGNLTGHPPARIGPQRRKTMYRARWISILLLLAVLLVGCSWPLSHPETEPLAAGKASSPVELSLARGEGRENGTPVASGSPATAPASPLTTPLTPVGSTPVVVSGRGEPFSGRTLRFTLPEGYRVLEGIDGGCFLYHESLPGFLVLYPQEGEPGEMLAGLLNATPGVDRSEPALEVDIGGLTFNGLFVETEAGSRLFLAASGGWTLVAQGPVDGWSTLAAGLNQVLLSLSFEEDF